MLDRQFINAIIITTLAGLSTSIGGAIGFIVTSKNLKFFSFTVGFTGGVMVGISFFELLPSGIEDPVLLRGSIEGDTMTVTDHEGKVFVFRECCRLPPPPE